MYKIPKLWGSVEEKMQKKRVNSQTENDTCVEMEWISRDKVLVPCYLKKYAIFFVYSLLSIFLGISF